MPTVTRAAITLALLGLLLGWFLLFRPSALGGPASYIMVSGPSMEPVLHGSDLAVTRKQDSYAIGDIVAFRVPKGEPAEGGMVIHRIVGGNAEEGFVMQGDNKNAPDLWRPTADDVVGRMWFRVPRAGLFLTFLRQPLALGAVVGGIGTLLVLSGGSGKPSPPGGTSQSRPAGSARGDPPGTRLILGLVLAGALTRVVAFLRRKDRGEA